MLSNLTALPVFLQAAPVPVPDSFRDKINFLQGNGVYEEGTMHFLREMRNTIWTNYDAFIVDAQALCAIFMLILFAIKAYEMMSGDKKMEVMPLLRPFGLVVVILWWPAFTRVLAYPTDLVSVRTENLFDGSQTEVNNLRIQRAKLMVDMGDQLFKIQAETETAKSEADTWYEKAWESVKSTVKEGYATVWNGIVEMNLRLQIGLKLLAASIFETLAIWILRIAVYAVFMLQIIFSTVLIILGPFAVAASILPAFRDSFSTWIARFISVNLYSGIAYLVMYISSLLQNYALQAEITRYQAIMEDTSDNFGKWASLAGNEYFSFGIVIVTYIIGALTMLTVPSISTWVISTSGISSAASTVGRGASSASRMARKLLTKLK